MRKESYIMLSAVQAILLLLVAGLFSWYVNTTEGYMKTIEIRNMDLNEEMIELRKDSVAYHDMLNQIEMRNEGIKYQKGEK